MQTRLEIGQIFKCMYLILRCSLIKLALYIDDMHHGILSMEWSSSDASWDFINGVKVKWCIMGFYQWSEGQVMHHGILSMEWRSSDASWYFINWVKVKWCIIGFYQWIEGQVLCRIPSWLWRFRTPGIGTWVWFSFFGPRNPWILILCQVKGNFCLKMLMMWIYLYIAQYKCYSTLYLLYQKVLWHSAFYFLNSWKLLK